MLGSVIRKAHIFQYQQVIVYFILLIGCGKNSDADSKEEYNQPPFFSETDPGSGPPAPE